MSSLLADHHGQTVSGMLVPYGVWSEVDSQIEGHFMERWVYGSLRKTLLQKLKTRVRGYFEHRRSQVFGAAPVMDVRRVWEERHGAFYQAELLDGIPAFVIDGLRKGLYGSSIGARPVEVEQVRNPGTSSHNPRGIEERTYHEVELFDISITSQPHYSGTDVALRSRPADGVIYRASAAPLTVTPAWALPDPPPRRVPDYLVGEERVDYLADPRSNLPIEYL